MNRVCFSVGDGLAHPVGSGFGGELLIELHKLGHAGGFAVEFPPEAVGLHDGPIVLLVGGIVDFGFFSVNLLAVLPASLLSILLFSSLGILLGSLCSAKAVGGVASILISGQSVLSGMWFPIEGLSGGFLKVMEALPFKNICVVLQQVAVPNAEASSLLKPILILLAYTAISIFLSAFFFVRNSKAK